ncbi:MAG: nucleoside kinase [Christensenellales bacterium]
MEKYCYVSYDKRKGIKTVFEDNTRLWQIADDMGAQDAVCALANGRLVSLFDAPEEKAEIFLLKPTEHEHASRVFMRGLTFVLYRAAREMYPERKLKVDYMLCGGVYCELGELSDKDIARIQKRMDELIEADEDFVLKLMRVDEARAIMLKEGLDTKAELLKFRPFDYYRLYRYRGFHNYFHGIMPKSAGCLKGARLYSYSDGILLAYPTPYAMAHTPIIEQPKYAEVFHQAERWAKELAASYVTDINNMLRDGAIEDFININEALHDRTIAEIANAVASRQDTRIVLVAGPSSSGKTTFASRLTVHLKALGKRCLPVSLDDYYKDKADQPEGEDGEPDFECIESLDTKKFCEDVKLLLAGEQAYMPRYDFFSGMRTDTAPVRIDGDIIIAEGIHGLNDALLKDVEKRYKFKIFISPLTTLNIDCHSVVMPEDLRLLRRLVRDKRARGFSFAQTFSIWDKVRHGEYKYILPYQETADVMFNSTLLYEPLLLKKHAYSDLRRFTPDMPNYPEALALLKFLNYFLSYDGESAVPRYSILREFIGH